MYENGTLEPAGRAGPVRSGAAVPAGAARRAAEPVYLDSGNGLIKGHDNGTIDPQGTTERAQAAAVLMRFCQQFVE